MGRRPSRKSGLRVLEVMKEVLKVHRPSEGTRSSQELKLLFVPECTCKDQLKRTSNSRGKAHCLSLVFQLVGGSSFLEERLNSAATTLQKSGRDCDELVLEGCLQLHADGVVSWKRQSQFLDKSQVA